jgi:hypothetical protein
MAKASQEPEKAVEPEAAPEPKATESKPNDGTWPKSEHVLHAEALYGRPAWLVEHVLSGVDAHEALNVDFVQVKIDEYLSTPTVTEG